jgi:hypothetical protein
MLKEKSKWIFYMLLLLQWYAAKDIRNKFPPKFAIANGFVIGSMPQVLQWTTANGEKKVDSLLNMS